jgi:L-ornithine N5-monooxygenase
MTDSEVSVLAVGAGPANLALAAALDECDSPALARGTLLLEQHADVRWQRGLLLPWARSQVSFLKDLATLRDPRSRFTFLNFLHDRGRLDEFVNLSTFNPLRTEFSEYLQWVAESLRQVRVRFNSRVVELQPRREGDGAVTGWLVTTAGGDRVLCRDLVIGAGRHPHVPDVFRSLPVERVIHSDEYSTRITQVPADRELRVVVVGGAQSSAEMFMALHEDLPLCRPTMVMRSVGMQNYQTSKFVNEVFFPSFIDEFYSCPPEVRDELLAETRLTNYGGLAPPFVDELYWLLYRQRLAGGQRSHVRILTQVASARMAGDDIVLDLQDRRSGKVEPLHCDLVLLGTGYAPGVPPLVRDLAARVGATDIAVSRRYRVDLGDTVRAALYLQGVNERTHGIADSLLSNLAFRSQDIVADLLARRAAAEVRS